MNPWRALRVTLHLLLLLVLVTQDVTALPQYHEDIASSSYLSFALEGNTSLFSPFVSIALALPVSSSPPAIRNLYSVT
ncbi:hypothetical protein E2C01_034507 [Portunus trituberculatus]|uniref:Uncharacterized protein n=1 Tax=Portunus trituberculatus TaxID=210409 RepID=A0A5B7F310_PORTR|nr:hypothetical protein [Portunus trituberculatus]